MSDAANLLSILRGELPVPPLVDSSASPSRHGSSQPLSLPRPPQEDVNHLNTLLNKLNPSSPSPPPPPPALPPPPPPQLSSSGSNSLLSILQGTTTTIEPTAPPTSTQGGGGGVPNFNFVSPFDLLSSASASVVPRPLSVISAQSIPTCYLSHPCSSSLSLSLSLPLDNNASSSPQILNIPLVGNLTSLTDSNEPEPPNLIPITLFTPNLNTPETMMMGGYRRIGITKSSIGYLVQPPSSSSSSSSNNNGKKKVSKLGGGVRIIDRDSGARFLLDKPFGDTTMTTTILHSEFSKQTTETDSDDQNQTSRGLLILGEKNKLAIWQGRDRFELPKGKDSQYQPRLILLSNNSQQQQQQQGFVVLLAKFHPMYPRVPKLVISLSNGKVGLINVEKLGKGSEIVDFNSLLDDEADVESVQWLPSDSKESVIDFAFSPNGEYISILKESSYSIHSTTTSRILFSAHLPQSIVSCKPFEITFLSQQFVASSSSSSSATTNTKTTQSVIRGVAISSRKGTKIDLIHLPNKNDSISSSSSSSCSSNVSITLESSKEEEEEVNKFNFSQIEFDYENSILYISSSLRGSLLGFKVDYTPPLDEGVGGVIIQESSSNKEFLWLDHPQLQPQQQTRQQQEEEEEEESKIKVSQVLETPNPTPVIQFVLDPSGGALILHSQGIQHVSPLPLPLPSSSSSSSSNQNNNDSTRPSAAATSISEPPSSSSSVRAPPTPRAHLLSSDSRPILSNPFSSTNGVVDGVNHPHHLPFGTLPNGTSNFNSTQTTTEEEKPENSSPYSPPNSTTTPSSSPNPNDEPEEIPRRRMSLEGSIHVQSEIEIKEELVDQVSWEFMRRASIPIIEEDEKERERDKDRDRDRDPRDREVEKVLKLRREKKEKENEKEKESTLGLESIDEPFRGDNISNESVLDHEQNIQSSTSSSSRERPEEEIKLSGPVVNAAIKSMKAATAAAAAQKNGGRGGGEGFQNTYKNYSSTSPPSQVRDQTRETTTSLDNSSSSSSSFVLPRQTPTTPSAQSPRVSVNQQEDNSSKNDDDIVKQFKRFQIELPKSIENIVEKELEKYLQRFEDERSGSPQALVSTTAREETLLKLVSQSVVKGTSRALDTALNETIVPSIQDIVSQEIETSLELGVRKILPREISSVILDPDFTRTLSNTLVPTLERTVTQLILSGLVPSFKHTLRKSVEEIMDEMSLEMVQVRKEIVKEQSHTVDKLENEIGGLKIQVGELKGMLERMEKNLLISQNAQTQTQTPLPPPPTNLKPEETLPPIPRSETPLDYSYEDKLTTLLQPSESPSFPSLVYFLNSSPPARLDKIFPPFTITSTGGQSSPAISMAVTLSLAFRLSELIKSREGAFAQDEQKWLEWLKRAIGACNDQQPPEFIAMIPRILDMVLNNLVTRGRKLMASGDHRGAGEIRTVEQYARARLSMF